MAALAGLSGAHAILLATHLCASGNVSPLPQLQARYPRWLPLERVLRILLTYLPESTPPQEYTSVLQELFDGVSDHTELAELDLSAIKDLPEPAARKRVRKLRLLPLKYLDDEDTQGPSDLLTQFLIHRAHRIDSETSLQPLILDLFLPFYERSTTLRTWLISSLLPLLRLNYEYYPSQDETFSLDILESMDDNTAINVLLSMTSSQKSNMDLVNNLRGLLGPWMYGSNRSKRRRLNEAAQETSITLPDDTPTTKKGVKTGWQSVNEWLLSHSLVDHESAVSAFTHWDGPGDVDLGGYNGENEGVPSDELTELRARYGQSGLAVIYANADTGLPSLDGSGQILTRVAQLLHLEGCSSIPVDRSDLPSVSFDTSKLSSSTRVSLLQNALLSASNPLTAPSSSSIAFLSAILLSLRALNDLGHPIPCRTAANICLHSNEEVQMLELKSLIASVVRQTRSGRDWRKSRQQLLWLRNWEGGSPQPDKSPSSYHGLFWRVPQGMVEAEILKALLEAKGRLTSRSLSLFHALMIGRI